MKGDVTQRVLQLIYDLFYGSAGAWPTLAYLQRALDRQSGNNVDAAQVVQHIPPTLLKPLRSSNGYPAPSEKLILTAKGVKRCAGSDEDIAHFVTAVQWLARRANLPDIAADEHERGMRFTTLQLAEAVPLSLDSDRNSIRRLVAILQAEGWVKEDGNARPKPWTRFLRRLGNPGIPWHRAILGL